MPLVLEPSWVGRRVSVRRVLERGRRRPAAVRRRRRRPGRAGRADRGHRHAGAAGRGARRRGGHRPAGPAVHRRRARAGGVGARGWRAGRDRPARRLAAARQRADSPGAANSVLPLRPPGLPLDEALERAPAPGTASAGCRCASRCRWRPGGCSTPSSAERGWHADADVARARRPPRPGARAAGRCRPSSIDRPSRTTAGCAGSATARRLARSPRACSPGTIASGSPRSRRRRHGPSPSAGAPSTTGGWASPRSRSIRLAAPGLAAAVMAALWRWGMRPRRRPQLPAGDHRQHGRARAVRRASATGRITTTGTALSRQRGLLDFRHAAAAGEQQAARHLLRRSAARPRSSCWPRPGCRATRTCSCTTP